MRPVLVFTNRYLSFPLIYLVSLTAYCVDIKVVEAGDHELDLFRTEYPKKLIKLKKAYSDVTMNGVFKSKTSDSESKLSITVKGDLKKLIQSSSEVDKSNISVPVGSEYAFSFDKNHSYDLRKTPDTNQKYTIVNMKKRDSAPAISSNADLEFRARGGRFVWSSFLNEYMETQSLFNKDLIKLQSADLLTEQGGRVLVLRFVNLATNSKKITGVAEFLIDRSWVLRRLDCKCAFPVKSAKLSQSATIDISTSSMVEYGADQDGIPVPTQITTVHSGKRIIFFVTDVKFNIKAKPSEFSLSYFGLPDVTAPPADPGRSNSPYWLFGLAVIALVAAVVVVRRRARGD